jgi:hypothetical protein
MQVETKADLVRAAGRWHHQTGEDHWEDAHEVEDTEKHSVDHEAIIIT